MQDVDIVNQLHLLGEQVAGPRSQLLDSLYSILEKHQPKAALEDTSARCAALVCLSFNHNYGKWFIDT